MPKIAFLMLISDRGKMVTALIGVIFSVVLVNLQGGLFVGLIKKASLLVSNCEADIWVGHRQIHNVDFPSNIPRVWLNRIKGIPDVQSAEPYVVGFTEMTLPSGGFEGVIVVGVDPKSLMGNAWNIVEGESQSVLRHNGIIIDLCDQKKLESPELGEMREIGGLRARVVAKSKGITGFLVNPYVFTTEQRAHQFVKMPVNQCSYFLVKTLPGSNLDEVVREIKKHVPLAEVLTKEQYSWISINYWLTRTGIGISFGAATVLGLLVGLVMVAQTLYAFVLDRLTEFGTLKAIGASGPQLMCILLIQALIIAVIGSIFGLIISVFVQTFFSTPRSPIIIPFFVKALSCVLVTAICMASSLLPYLKVRNLDPQYVIQS